MAETVYLFCALTSMLCAALLFRGYRATRMRLLLWSSLCFVCLTANSILLFVDFVILPPWDMALWRGLLALLGLMVLLFGLVWESR